jgi:hypothetical protein
MFSAWDFNSWIASVGVMLFIVGLLTGFGALVSALMSRIWEEESDAAATPRMGQLPKESSTRKVA